MTMTKLVCRTAILCLMWSAAPASGADAPAAPAAATNASPVRTKDNVEFMSYVFAEAAGHTDGRVTRQILPGALEWLWQGYPLK